MERKTFERSPCSVARSLAVLGDWWNPLIIRECLLGVHRFDGFQRWLGIGRNILSRRLTLLEQEGVLERRLYQERPKRYEYYLTAKGYDAATLLLAMMPFGERWYFESEPPPVMLYHRDTDKPVRPLLVDAETGQPLDPKDVYSGPGPAFPGSESLRRERFTEFYRRREQTETRAPDGDQV